jgi:hypothetical protein
LIISRPQRKSLFAFILVLLGGYALTIVNAIVLIRDPAPQWINYLIVVVLAPLSAIITYKTVFQYKVIRMGSGRIEVRYAVFMKDRSYALADVESWSEAVVKTGKSSAYRELVIRFTDQRKITMAWREYTEYEKMIQYLSQKKPNAKTKG